MPYGDSPSDTCHGKEYPRPLAVSASVFCASLVVLSPQSTPSQPLDLAYSTIRRVLREEMTSARAVAEVTELSRLESFPAAERSVLVDALGSRSSKEVSLPARSNTSCKGNDAY